MATELKVNDTIRWNWAGGVEGKILELIGTTRAEIEVKHDRRKVKATVFLSSLQFISRPKVVTPTPKRPVAKNPHKKPTKKAAA